VFRCGSGRCLRALAVQTVASGKHGAARRGQGRELHHADGHQFPDLTRPHSQTEQSLLEIDDALNRLAAINPALRRVVELRVFEGLTREEIAQQMGCGTATVARHWNFARNWLE
jgi:RNA polymerase sigma factor (sigma-70 family)